MLAIRVRLNVSPQRALKWQRYESGDGVRTSPLWFFATTSGAAACKSVGMIAGLLLEEPARPIWEAYLPTGSTLIAGGRISTGDTPEGNARAQADSWLKILKFLASAFRH